MSFWALATALCAVCLWFIPSATAISSYEYPSSLRFHACWSFFTVAGVLVNRVFTGLLPLFGLYPGGRQRVPSGLVKTGSSPIQALPCIAAMAFAVSECWCCQRMSLMML